MPRSAPRILALLALASCFAAVPARAETVFRPLIADPREPMLRWRMVSYTEDRRYGTDITDSTSQGGVARDQQGMMWEVDAGHVFRWKPLRRMLGFAPPWTAYQLGVPAAVFPVFDNSGSLVNADYQFGASFEVQWNGPRTESGSADTPPRFSRPLVTSRLTAFHRSSHVGDEYLATSRFGRNLESAPAGGSAFDHPPVKRVDLTYEGLAGTLSVEASPGRAVARAYAGFEMRPLFPPRWGIGALRPHNFTSPAWTVGGELRSAGNGPPPPARLASLVNVLLGEPAVDAGWFAAAELRLAKPYNFASADNPAGESEVWTPRLWTDAPYGREFRHYAGSWHAMVGAVAWPHVSGTRSPLGGREYRVALEWYQGYSPDGQFLDQRLRWHPRWYVVPSVSAQF